MLKGTHILVTGASSGIGRAVTLLLAHEEVNLHLVGRDAETLAELARQARSWGAQTQLYPLDLLEDDALKAFAEGFTAPLGALIHSAGVVTLGTLRDADINDFDAQYRLNVRAPYLLTQLLLGRLEQAGGQVVFINSGAGLNAHAGWGQYAATKHALRAVADSLRAEMAGSGVRVVSVYPGRTATPMQKSVYEQEGRVYEPSGLIQPADVAAVVKGALELPPTASVTDVTVRPPS